jgi:RNase P/RNase MRP subunit POP5
MTREVKNKVKKELRKKVKDIVNKRLGHVRIQINKLWLVNRIRIIVRGIISKIIVGYTERLGILKRNVSQVKGLIGEIGAAIQLDIGRDVKGKVNTEKAVKRMMDKTVKTVQGIIKTSEKKIIKDLEAKIAEALASIKAYLKVLPKRENNNLEAIFTTKEF